MVNKKRKYNFPAAQKFPGKFNKNNKDGTLLTKLEWQESEARKWVQGVKEFGDHENDKFSNRASALKNWLKNTQLKFSKSEARELLVRLEAENINDEVQTEDKDEQIDDNADLHSDEEIESMDVATAFEENEEFSGGMEIEDGSQDMFADMETIEPNDKNRAGWEKEEAIKRYLALSDEELMRCDLPDIVSKDNRYLERQKIFVQNLLDTKLESSQDILNQMSQLPECVQNHHLLKDKISHLSKKRKELQERI